MKRALVTNLIMIRDLDRYRPALEAAGVEAVAQPVRQYLTEAELLPLIGGFDGVIAGDDQFTERVLQAGLPRLKVISKWGVGLDAIDLPAAARLGVRVFNTPGAFNDAVGEQALGYMLVLARQILTVDRDVRQGKWPKPESEGLKGKTLGVIGFGGIGRAVVSRAQAFGMAILAHDVMMAKMDPVPNVLYSDLDALLSASDFVCLCCNLTPENRGMIGAPQLQRMKSTASLINVARGPLVQEAALEKALQEGTIAGAGLDVFESEPLPASHPLAALDNVVLGSHNANNVRAANDAVCRIAIDNLLKGLEAADAAGA